MISPFKSLMRIALTGSLLPLLAASADAQASNDSSIYKFVLDYAVPESPAFAILGVTPEKILRGSAAKPVVASLLTQLQTGGKLKSGVAIDLTPYFVYGGTIRNIKEYAENQLVRILANTQLSIATIQSPTDTTSMGGSLAIRMNILDAGDPLRDPAALKPLFDALNRCASAPTPAETPEEVTRARCATVAEAFAKVKGSGTQETRVPPGCGRRHWRSAPRICCQARQPERSNRTLVDRCWISNRAQQ